MAVSEEFRTEVMDYCRIEPDDADVSTIIDAAVQKMEIETGKLFEEKKPLAKQVVKMIVLDWYDHRGSITTENIHEIPFPVGAQMLMNQIALSSEFERKPMPGEKESDSDSEQEE